MARDLTTPISGITKDRFKLKSLHVDTDAKSVQLVYSIGYDEYLEWQDFVTDPSGYLVFSELSGGGGTTATYEVCGDAISGWYEVTSTASANVYRPQDFNNTVITNSYIRTNNVTVASDGDGNMPTENPYTTLVGRMQDGNWAPESTMADFFEYVLVNYAGI